MSHVEQPISAAADTEPVRGLRQRFWEAVQRCTDFLNSIEVTPDPIHRDFHVIDDGWYWNRVKQPARDPELKVRIFFNATELHLLDDCSFPCKFGATREKTDEFAYIGFAYPKHSGDMPALEAWAQRFPDAVVMTYGRHIVGGGWDPGSFVRGLSREVKGG